MAVPAFKQLCLATDAVVSEVCSAIAMDGANAVQVSFVFVQCDPAGGGELVVVLERSNDRENWTADGGEPLAFTQPGFYVLDALTGICTAAVRLRATLSSYGSEFAAVISADVNLRQL